MILGTHYMLIHQPRFVYNPGKKFNIHKSTNEYNSLEQSTIGHPTIPKPQEYWLKDVDYRETNAVP